MLWRRVVRTAGTRLARAARTPTYVSSRHVHIEKYKVHPSRCTEPALQEIQQLLKAELALQRGSSSHDNRVAAAADAVATPQFLIVDGSSDRDLEIAEAIGNAGDDDVLHIVGDLSLASNVQSAINALDQRVSSVVEKCVGVCARPPLTVIHGPMFAGKTTRLVEFYEDVAAMVDSATGTPLLRIAVVKPAIDDRSAANIVRTHDGRTIVDAQSYSSLDFQRDFKRGRGQASDLSQALKLCPDVFIIDEGHFFGA